MAGYGVQRFGGTPVKSTRRYAVRAAGLVALVVVGAPALVAAQPPQQPQQRGGPPNPDTPRILVATFRSDERQLGVQAADALRKRSQDENSAKQLFAVTKREVDATLQQSGYNPDSALSTGDLMELGHQVRADEVVDATVRKMADGQVRIDARLLLKRNQNILAQPLPPGFARNTPVPGLYAGQSPPTNQMVLEAPLTPPPSLVHEVQQPTPDTAAEPPPVFEQPTSVSYFYDELAPYGTWIDVGGYARC